MMKYAIILNLCCLLSNFTVSAAIVRDTSVDYKSRIETLESENKRLRQQLDATEAKILTLENKTNSLSDSLKNFKNELIQTESNIKEIADTIGLEIKHSSSKTNAEIVQLNDSIGRKTLYWIIAFLLASGFSVVLFFVLKKQFNKDKIDLTDQIKKTSDILRDEQLKLDDQLLKLLESQMKLIAEERRVAQNKLDETDHSLALKVADEIVRIQKNLTHMDPETKGLKQLSASVKRIQDNFEANGYELVEMLNKPYHEGMKVTVNFITNDNLAKGEQIITRIIKPQVNFRGNIIQTAQIEVSCGEE